MTLFEKAGYILKNNWFSYLIGLAAILGLKLFYRSADSCELMWILTPVAWWVGILSRNTFVNIPHVGYVNHSLQLIIAKSCSGVSFMIIVLAVLIFSYTHRAPSRKKRFLWISLSFALSYLFTILVNSLRIILSIYLPSFLENRDICRNLLTPDRLHTLIGTAVYFTSLLVIYNFAGWLSFEIAGSFSEIAGSSPDAAKTGKPLLKTALMKPLRRLVPPAFWYFFMVLGIPLLHNAKNGYEQFAEFALLITVVCGIVLGISYLFALCARRWR